MKVICKLPNASDCINGVKFTPQKMDDGVTVMVSEDVSQEVAAAFTAITGYEVAGDEKDNATKLKKTATATSSTT